MTQKTVPDLKELFKQASEIAKQVPENMQEAAFNRALDMLTGESNKEQPEKDIPDSKKIIKKKNRKFSELEQKDDGHELITKIDSTQHPGVTSATKVLDRALMILQIALQDHAIDGLTPSEIAHILTDKFRVRTDNNSVNMGLGRATNLVDRIHVGKGYKYRIMEPGEKYLAHLNEGDSKALKKSATPIKSKQSNRKKSSKKAKGKTAPTKRNTGPKAAIINLIKGGYFEKGRTGPELKTYLKCKKGHDFGIDQLNLAMLRLVRDEQLERTENQNGKYEYKKP